MAGRLTDRVVEVSAGNNGARGTGVLVAERLILTAAHVVREGPVWVRLSGATDPLQADEQPASVAWDGSARGLDAALLEIPVERWEPPPGGVTPLPFGRILRRTGEIGASVLGLPGTRGGGSVPALISAAALPGRSRRGSVTSARHQVTLAGPGADARGPGGARPDWSPGSPVICADPRMPDAQHLLALVVAELPDRRADRFAAEPVWRLLRVPDFVAAVERVIAGPHTTAVELDPALREPVAPPPSPAALLSASAASVEFYGREAELGALDLWCRGGGVRVALIHGPTGQGKTRLAAKLLADQLSAGWVGGFLRTPPALGPAAQAALAEPAASVLLVVDNADMCAPAELADLLRDITGGTDAGVRVLLLARSAGGWWRDPGQDPRVRDAHVISLGPLDPEPDLRAAAYRQVAWQLADAFHRVFARHGVPGAERLPEVAMLLPDPDDLADPRYAHALTVQTAVATRLLDAVRPTAEGQSWAARLLSHEVEYWRDTATRHGVKLGDRARLQAVCAAALCGAQDADEARRLLAALRMMPADRTLREKVSTWLHELYPSPDGAYWQPLTPERFAEELVGAALRGPDPLVDARQLNAVAAAALDGQRHRMLTVLSRVAAHDGPTAGLLAALVSGSAELHPVARRVAAQVPDPEPLLRGLHPPREQPPDEVFIYVVAHHGGRRRWWHLAAERTHDGVRLPVVTAARDGRRLHLRSVFLSPRQLPGAAAPDPEHLEVLLGQVVEPIWGLADAGDEHGEFGPATVLIAADPLVYATPGGAVDGTAAADLDDILGRIAQPPAPTPAPRKPPAKAAPESFRWF
ncbi:trypsin-like peptidase domain-containing protein [Virgisporangium aliadipatigenens]|uniref:trypsin-like peptidase domain-containing protein n=1 Tax=Virgisporangium aliadipatigenens TaxID=741659 RepID=UPI0019459C0B|nr:trypsin-like peptidase domain-containing protein [Virgisporangium aliadipatigenens]